MVKRHNILILLLCLTMLCGCSLERTLKHDRDSRDTNKTMNADTKSDKDCDTKEAVNFPTDYVDCDLPLLVASCTSYGPYSWGTDYWTDTNYVLKYNGDIEITQYFTLSGEEKTTAKMGRADFKDICRLLKKVTYERPFDHMNYDGYCDGVSWGFETYDLNGKGKFLYGGYTYECTDMESIQDLLKKYEPAYDLTARSFNIFAGTYVCPDNNQQYIEIFKNDARTICLKIHDVKGDQIIENVYETDIFSFHEKGISFGYWIKNKTGGPERMYAAFYYSEDKNTLQDMDTGITYVRQ